MNNAVKLVLTGALCLGLVACASKDTMPEDDGSMDRTDEPDRGYVPPETMAGPDPRNYGLVENLTNPDSILSQRVIYFDYDQATIRREFRELVSAHASFLAANRNYRATLEGHADERGTREYNLALGERRAKAVSNVLDVQGAGSNQLTEVSYGEERPVATCSRDDCWSRNRRVEIVYTTN